MSKSNRSVGSKNSSAQQNSRDNRIICPSDDLMRNKTKTQASLHEDECFCQECQCGRHLCGVQLTIEKPALTWKTIYKQQFVNRLPKHKNSSKYHLNQNIQNPAYKEKVSTIKLNSETQYHRRFQTKGDQDVKFSRFNNNYRQRDIQSAGPFQITTTYNSNFIGHHGLNQYVKIQEKSLPKGVAFHGKSMYQTAYSTEHGTSLNKDSFQRSRAATQESEIVKKINRLTYRSTYKNCFKTETGSSSNQIYYRPSYNSVCNKITNSLNISQNPQKTLIHQMAASNHRLGETTNYQQQFKIKPMKPVCSAGTKILHLKSMKIQNRDQRFLKR